MTLAEALNILKTKSLPMSDEELVQYRAALKIVAGSFAIVPEE